MSIRRVKLPRIDGLYETTGVPPLLVTEWFGPLTKPLADRVGVYKTRVWPGVIQFSWWDGTLWCSVADTIEGAADPAMRGTKAHYQDRAWCGVLIDTSTHKIEVLETGVNPAPEVNPDARSEEIKGLWMLAPSKPPAGRPRMFKVRRWVSDDISELEEKRAKVAYAWWDGQKFCAYSLGTSIPNDPAFHNHPIPDQNLDWWHDFPAGVDQAKSEIFKGPQKQSDIEVMLRRYLTTAEGRGNEFRETLGITFREARAILAEFERMRTVISSILLQAQLHAGEAKGANETIYQIYQHVTGATGEPGNWNGAKPVIEEIDRLRSLAEHPDRRESE